MAPRFLVLVVPSRRGAPAPSVSLLWRALDDVEIRNAVDASEGLVMMTEAFQAALNDASPKPSANASPRGSDDISLGAADNVSPRAARDASSEYSADVAPVPERRCGWCPSALTDPRAEWCSQKCRQAGFRFRRRRATDIRDTEPKRLAYADPPYPGKSHLYRDQPTYGGEVDHVRLLERLATYDGWALSTSAAALREILPLCPPEHRVCAWVKPGPPSPRTFGLHGLWEPLIVVPGRRRRPGVADRLIAQPARGGGQTLIGRKPIAFVAWLFDVLGASPASDSFDDLYPGTGIVGNAWDVLASRDRLPRSHANPARGTGPRARHPPRLALLPATPRRVSSRRCRVSAAPATPGRVACAGTIHYRYRSNMIRKLVASPECAK